MNILIIDNSIAFTGAFKCALNEAMLLSHKHRFVFVIPQSSTLRPMLEKNGLTVYTLPMLEIRKSIPVMLKYFPALYANTNRLHKIVRKENIDAVQVNDFYNQLGVMLKRRGFKGSLFTYVRFLPSVMPGVLRKMWLRAANRHADKIIAVSDAVLQQLPDTRKAIRIYDPVQLTELLPPKEEKAKDTIDILYLSNYIRGKGQDHALEAFALAYKQNNSLRLKFTGGDMGLEKNRLFKQELEEKAKKGGLPVSFTAFNSNVEQEIKAADIMLNCSQAESFSMTCLEAAFYGTALIATRCGGPEEIIADKETGLLVQVGNINEICDAILTLANNAAVRKEFAEAGRTYVRTKFAPGNFMRQFESILKDTE